MERLVTYDFLIVFHSNHTSILCNFRDKWQYLQHFPIPLYLLPPMRGYPLKFCNGGGARITRMMPLPERHVSDNISIRLDAVSVLARQTELVKQYSAMYALHAEAR